MTAEQTVNTFLVHVFDDILRLEQASLHAACPELSLRELHVLEAVQQCARAGDVYMADAAAWLGVTAGTLTVAAATLERKGFLTRTRSPKDKRRVALALTAQAAPVLRAHAQFHEEMVRRTAEGLPAPQLDALAAALQNLHGFFREDAARL